MENAQILFMLKLHFNYVNVKPKTQMISPSFFRFFKCVCIFYCFYIPASMECYTNKATKSCCSNAQIILVFFLGLKISESVCIYFFSEQMFESRIKENRFLAMIAKHVPFYSLGSKLCNWHAIIKQCCWHKFSTM